MTHLRLARRLVLGALLAAGCVASGRHGDAALERPPLTGAVPWTAAPIRSGGDDFSFAIVTDRTGEHRDGIFERAIERIGLLKPDFVVSVGDLIEGYTEDLAELRNQWDEFQGIVRGLDVPFFYTPGNHDYSNPVMATVWRDRFGPSYYHFRYKGVLFLVLNSELFSSVSDPSKPVAGPDTREGQLAYAKRVLAEPHARWTIVLIHQPLWDRPQPQQDWLAIEEMLGTRPYTVFAGHFHNYTKQVRNDRRYITLATTGGASRLRGKDRGEFDEVALVHMGAQGGPVLANLMLDGIEGEDVRTEAQRTVVGRLDRALSVEPALLPARSFRSGKVDVVVHNEGAVPLEVEGRFEAGADLTPSPERVSLKLDPGAQQRVPVTLRAARPIDLASAAPALAHFTLASEDAGVARVQVEQQSWLLPDTRFPCPRARKKVEVDGDLSEWPPLPFAVRERPSQRDEATLPKGGSFRFGVSYDDDFVYVAVDVHDPTPFFDAARSERRQDAVGVTLDARPDPQRSDNEPFFRAIANGNMSQMIFAWLVPGDAQPDPIFRAMLPAFPDGAQRAVRRTADGYRAELAVPRSLLDARQGGPWRYFRLELSQQDFDAKGVRSVSHAWRPSRFGTSEALPVRGSGTFERAR